MSQPSPQWNPQQPWVPQPMAVDPFTHYLRTKNSLKGFDIAAIVGASVGGLIMVIVLLLTFLSNPVGTLLALVLAVVPLTGLFFFYRWLDSYEPEPLKLLLLAFLWGSCGATGVALVVNTVIAALLGPTLGLAAFAPVVEESMKGCFLLALLYFRRADIDGIVDGLVYAGVVAGGFAFSENIIYFSSAWTGVGADGTSTGIHGPAAIGATFLLRALMSPFAHPIFTSATGIGVGIAVSTRSNFLKVAAPLLGWVVAVGLHATWNGSTLVGAGKVFMVVYMAFEVPLFVAYMLFAVQQRRKLTQQLWNSLTDASRRGLIPANDLYWIVNEKSRGEAVRYMEGLYGKQGKKLIRDYQGAAVRLGFLHHKVLANNAPRDYQFRGLDLSNEIRRLRPYIPIPL